jgi:hypothetical protein
VLLDAQQRWRAAHRIITDAFAVARGAPVRTPARAGLRSASLSQASFIGYPGNR